MRGRGAGGGSVVVMFHLAGATTVTFIKLPLLLVFLHCFLRLTLEMSFERSKELNRAKDCSVDSCNL